MKKMFKTSVILILAIFVYACTGNKANDNSAKTDSTLVKEQKPAQDGPLTAASEGKVQHITTNQFIKHVNDFRSSSTFAMKSELPCVIDFYADWCKPCKMISPFLDELAEEYKGKVHFLKINVDEEPEISNFYQIQAIPAMMFCPLKGNYVMEIGGSDKATIKKNVEKNVMK